MGVEDFRPPFFLGLDLGGTNIKAGVVDDEGRPLSSISVPTHADRGPHAGADALADAARQAVERSGVSWGKIEAIGLGSPGPMDIPEGTLIHPSNLPNWGEFPLRHEVSERLGRPVTFQNDANAAAYGEFWSGAGKEVESLVLFTLGTGIGGGIIDHGRIVQGRHSHGGECGHIIIEADGGRLCPCGGRGHLEAYASATSLVARAREALEAGEPSTLSRSQADGTLTSQAINNAAEAGDALAQRLMSETARYLAAGAVSVMHTIDPDLVLFGGGMIAAGRRFLEAIRAEVHTLALPIPGARTRIDYASLGGDAGFIGAAGCARLALKPPASASS